MRSVNLLQTVLLTAIILCCTTSCDKDEMLNEKYDFKEIKYSLENGDGIIEIKKELYPLTVTNNTASPAVSTNYPYANIYRTIEFRSDEVDAFTWMDQNEVLIDIPYYIVNGIIYMEKDKQAYGKELSIPEPIEKEISSTTVPPHMKLEITGSMIYQQLTVTYNLTIVGSHSKKEKQIKGKLIYTMPHHHEGHTKLSSL